MNHEAYSPAEVSEALRASGGLVTDAADALGCSRPTIYAYLKKYPEVAQAKEDSEEKNLDIAESKLMEAVKNREAWAICFFLKCKGKKRGYSEKGEYEADLEEYTITFSKNGKQKNN
jgi:predicted transcriptional regulator